MPQFEVSDLTLLLCQIAVILLACRLLGRLAAAIGQPQVIAEVTAGILLGPSLLGWLWPEGLVLLFPADSLTVLKMLSQIGLVLFMFLVGLEFDPRLLRGRTHASVAISHTSIIVPFVLGVGAAWWLYDRYGPADASWFAFALFMGVAMSVTAFPVLARILSERNLLHSRVGAIAIACAAVDDVTAWCLLAFVVAVVHATGLTQALWTTGFALAYILVMLGVVQPFLRRLAARVGTSDDVPPTIVAVTLLLLLMSSALTEFIGIHALFGAFVFGAILPKEGRFAETLVERLETVAVMLLLPLFFAYSGLRTEIGLISGRTEWLVTGAIILIATIGKFGGSAVAARLTGLRWREAGAIGILMNTRGLMELIVLNIGMDLGVISPTMFTMLVIMALVTTFATTPILALVYPDRELARDRLVEVSPVTADAQTPYTIMLAVSHAAAGPALMTLASALLASRNEPSRVFALHLRPPVERASAERRQRARQGRFHPALAPLLDHARDLMIEVRPLGFVSVDPATDIVRTADAKQAHLLLLGAHKPLLLEGQFGGTVAGVLDLAERQITGVLIDRGLRQIRRVLVHHTDSPHDGMVNEIAQRLAAVPGVVVTTVASTIPPAEFDRLASEQDLVILGVPDVHSLDLSSSARRLRSLLADCPSSVLAIAAPSPEHRTTSAHQAESTPRPEASRPASTGEVHA